MQRRSRFIVGVGLCLLAVVIAASAPRLIAQSKPAAWDGVYSAAQAKRGEALYAQNCVTCHGKDLAGSERGPAVGGPGLTARWSSRPLGDLLDYMHVQMPLNSPGGLTRHQNADILAFMLQRTGAAPGPKDLWIDGAEGGSSVVPRSADYGKVAEKSTKRSEAFFTAAQAARGRIAWNRNCAFCHSVDPKNSTPQDLVQPLPSTFGGHFIERVVNGKVVYPNVLALYSKLKSMPAFNVNAITEQERVDIAAYILQANGLPAGNDEIPVDTDAMRLMMTNEPGFERIFNGKDFTGWNFLVGPNCRPAADGGCGKMGPLDVARVENQAIVCDCHVHGFLYPDKKYKDFTLRFDMKFEKPAELAPEDDEELFSGGSGYLIFADVQPGGVYPKSIEVEGRYRDLLEYVGIIGSPVQTAKLDLEAKRRAMRPLGQWNQIEISARGGGRVESRLNGVLVSAIDKHDYNYPGHIVFQMQGAKMAWRNIRIRVD
jgi:mono/diheme cytochrome c family protein